MWSRFYSISLNTFHETIRQPIYGVILVVTALLLMLNVALAGFTLDDDNKLLLDIGLSTLLMSGLFLAAFSATGVISREIENKTVLSVVSKPVGRPTFILAKFAGVTVAMLLAYYLSFLVFVLAQRHGVMQNSSDPWDAPVLTLGFGCVGVSLLVAGFCNYFYNNNFQTTAVALVVVLLTLGMAVIAKFDEEWQVIPFASNFVGGQVLIAAFLVMLVVVITGAVAVAVSTRFGQMMTLLICTAFLGLGLISDYSFGQHAESSSMYNLLYHMVPNVGPFWVIDGLYAESEESTIPLRYVGYVTAYAALITTAVLGLAVTSFQTREVG